MGKISGEFILNKSSYEEFPNGLGTLKNKRSLSEYVLSQNYLGNC
jgi:hypothetical protein